MKVWGIIGTDAFQTTRLMDQLVAECAARGLTVSTIKQTPAAFDVDQPGKDSYRHRDAGATEVLLSSRKRWAHMHELRGQAVPSLEHLLAKLAPVDLVLVEGFADAPDPKIEAYRSETGELLVRVVVSTVTAHAADAPVLSAHDAQAIVDTITREPGP